MAEHRDPYAVLGVERSASDEDIRTAYRKLARDNHPDVNPDDPGAESRFKEVGAAYEVLSDPDRRRSYDEFGEQALRNGFDPEQARAYQQWHERRAPAGSPFGGVPGFAADGPGFDLSDLFDLGGGGQRRARGPERGADLRAVVELDLAQALRGAEISLEVPSTERCSDCGGSGHPPGSTPSPCQACGGSGQREVARGPMRMAATCPSCGGSGSSAPACPSCKGRGQRGVRRRVTVRIPPGADDGSTLRISGKGAAGEEGGPAGDLVIHTRVRPHPLFRRDGLDLTLTLPITLHEAYNGAQIDIPTFQGPVTLTVPPRSQPGSRLRLRGKGVERAGERGALYVQLDVRLPDQHDEHLAEAARRAEAAYAEPVRAGLGMSPDAVPRRSA